MRNEFIKFLIEANALKFGEFTLKSGRVAPYFINMGCFCTGRHLAKLGEFYADCIIKNRIDFETLFGPAYKGIPLSTACAVALYEKHGVNAGNCFDRKEAKDHGEGGVIVGKKLEDGEKVLIIEDVITAGTAIRQVLPVLENAAKVKVIGIVISVDRMEKGTGELSAVQEVKENFGIDVYPIITVWDIIEAIKSGEIQGMEYLDKMLKYREKYGC